MYSPTMRLLAVLELLENFQSLSGSELARRLEVEVRTIRRYIYTLQDMGIPVAAERGPYGGYRLERGSRLPPLIFNDSEAAAIIMGLRAIRQLHFPVDVTAVEAATAKIERLLPEKILDYVQDLESLLIIHNPSFYSVTKMSHSDFVFLLGEAIRKQRRMMLTYSARNGKETRREVDLYGLVWMEGQWYTAGYCHMRNDLRTFRIDRIVEVSSTDQRFDRPPTFDISRFVLESRVLDRNVFEIEVLLKTSIEQARVLLPSDIAVLEATGEGVVFRHSTTQLDWVAYLLLNLKLPFVVRKPPELHDVFRQISERAAQAAEG